MPQISEQEIEGCETADGGDQTIEEGEGEVALFSYLPAQDEVRHADRSDGDEEAQREDKNGTAGSDSKGDHVGNSRGQGTAGRGSEAPEMGSEREVSRSFSEVFG